MKSPYSFTTIAEIEFEIHRIRRMTRPCGWKGEKCRPLYARLSELKRRRAQDTLLDDATHAAADKFADCGIALSADELYRINDLLTEILGNRVPAM